MPHLFVYTIRSYTGGYSLSTCKESRKIMAWTRSGHSLRSNPRSSHLTGSFKSCFRLNRFKLTAGWVYCRRRSHEVHKNTLRANKAHDSDKCENAQCDAMDQLSIVTRYHMLLRSNSILRDNYDLVNFEPSDSTCPNVSQQQVQQGSKPSEKSYMFNDDMKWKEVWSSFLGCPYSEIHNSRANKNIILMKMQKNEKELTMNGANDFKFNQINDSATDIREINSQLRNRLIILKGPDNCIKNIPSTSFNLTQNKSKDCLSTSNGHCNLSATDGISNLSDSKKNWSLFRISNGSIIPLYWVQNNQNSPNQIKTELISNDLKVNNANWFTKSVLSNLVGQSSQSTVCSTDPSKSLLSGYFNPSLLGGLSSDHEKESDSQKLIRSCHEFVYDNSGSQIHRCKSCTKLFTSLAAFCDHVVSTHNQAKNRCGVCHKHFSRSWLLKGHMRTHTGERPYKCHHPGCNKAFADKSNLRSHTLIHTVVGKKFVCQRCQRAFAQKRYLHKHQFEVCKILT